MNTPNPMFAKFDQVLGKTTPTPTDGSKPVTSRADEIRALANSVTNPSTQQVNQTADQKSAERYGASNAATTGEGPLQAGIKAVENVPSSIYGLGKNLANTALHPIKTTEGIFNTIAGGVEKGVGKLIGKEAPNDTQTQTFDSFVGSLKDRYGSLENLQRTATNDPAGFGLDVLTLVQGAAKLADVASGAKTAEATNAANYTNKINDTVKGIQSDPQLASDVPTAIKGIKDDLLENFSKEEAARNGVTKLGPSIIKKIDALNPSDYSSIQDFTNDVLKISGKGQGYFSNLIDSAVSKIASPVTGTASKLYQGAKTLGQQLLGASTGTGASSIRSASEGSPEFVAAMRGKVNPDQVVQSVQDAVDTIKQNRADTYRQSLAQLGEDTKTHDISSITNEVDKQLKNFGVKIDDEGQLDFSRSSIANNGSARSDIQGVYNTLKEWGTQPGDRTGVGLDTLKKQLGDFYSPSGSARAFVQGVKSKVSNVLNTEVPGYSDMTKNYQSASNLLDDIKSATGVGGSSKIDTVFTKLTTALKGDKELRLEVLNSLQDGAGDPTIMDKIAGTNMQSLIPKGLVGKGIDVGTAFGLLKGAFNPSYIPILLSTSPRVVGEFVRALGWTASKTSSLVKILNTITKASPIADFANETQSNLKQSQQ